MSCPRDIESQEALLLSLKQRLHSNHYIANIVKRLSQIYFLQIFLKFASTDLYKPGHCFKRKLVRRISCWDLILLKITFYFRNIIMGQDENESSIQR